MRSCPVLLAILIAAVAECCQPEEEIRAMLRAYGEQCVQEKETELNRDELHDIFALKCPTTPNAKCIMSCIAEKSGIVQDNQFSLEQFMDSLNKTLPCDQDTMKKVEETARKCGSDIGDVKGECEIGLKFCECLRQHQKEEGKDRGRT